MRWSPSFDEIRTDVRRILDAATPAEVLGVRSLLRLGRINGYWYGDSVRRDLDGKPLYCCLVGSIARMRGAPYERGVPIVSGIRVNEFSAAELFIKGIGVGHTPSNHGDAARLDNWLTEWLEENGIPRHIPIVSTLQHMADGVEGGGL